MAFVVLLLAGCLTSVSVHCQDVKRTSTTSIFVDRSTDHQHQQGAAFHVQPNVAETATDLNQMSRVLESLGPNLPDALSQMLRSGNVDTAVNEANEKSASLLTSTSGKVEKALQIAKNNVALEQVLQKDRNEMMARAQLEQELIKQLLKERAVQQQQQQNLITTETSMSQPGDQLIPGNMFTSTKISKVEASSVNSPLSSPDGSSSTTSSITSISSATSNSQTSEKSSKKKALAEKLRKLKAKIEAKKRAKAAAKAKADADKAAQRQEEELSKRNEFNTDTSVTSEQVLASAVQNAQHEAAVDVPVASSMQMTTTNNDIQLGFNPANSNQLGFNAANANQLGFNAANGIQLGSNIANANQLGFNVAQAFSNNNAGTSDIGTINMAAATSSLFGHPTIARQRLSSTFGSRGTSSGFFARVNPDGTVEPIRNNVGMGGFNMSPYNNFGLAGINMSPNNNFGLAGINMSPNNAQFLSSPVMTYSSMPSQVVSPSMQFPINYNSAFKVFNTPTYSSQVITYPSTQLVSTPYTQNPIYSFPNVQLNNPVPYSSSSLYQSPITVTPL